MKLSECEIGDVIELGQFKYEYLGIVDLGYKGFPWLSHKLNMLPNNILSHDYVGHDLDVKLISRKSKQNQIQEIQSLKIELQNIQKKIEKLEEENQLELGGIYEVSYQGNIIKGCVVEDLKNCYRFITKTTARYLLEKHLITSFKKLPDESVKQFFKKIST